MNAPSLRFQEFHEEWVTEKISYIFNIRSSGDTKSDQLSKVKNLTHHYPVFSNALTNDGIMGYYSFYQEEAPAITVTARGDIGHPINRVEPFNAVGRLLVLHLKDSNFSTKFFTERLKMVSIFNETTGVPQLTAPSYGEYLIKFPTYKEQKKIDVFFILLDQRIHKQQEKVELLKEQKKGLMQKIYSQELRFKKESGQEYPEWQTSKLGKFLIQYTEKTTINNQYPALTSSRKGLFLQNDYFNYQIASDDNTGYNIVPRNYFTYRHMSDDITFKFNINTLVDFGIVSTLYPVFTTSEFLDSDYLKFFLNESDAFKKYGLLQKQGGSRTYMYYSKLVEFEAKWPNIEEQKAISRFLLNLDSKVNLENNKLNNLNQQKQALMQQMFI